MLPGDFLSPGMTAEKRPGLGDAPVRETCPTGPGAPMKPRGGSPGRSRPTPRGRSVIETLCENYHHKDTA